MKLMAVITSERSGVIPNIGMVSRLRPTVIDEFKMVRAEARLKQKFGEIKMPNGVQVMLVVLKDDEELDLETLNEE